MPDRVLDQMLRTIERYRMFDARQHVAVAVSGGADSVCLLHALVALAPRWGLELSVLHVDHHLRGEESRLDAEFVRDLAARLGLPFTLRELDLSAWQAGAGPESPVPHPGDGRVEKPASLPARSCRIGGQPSLTVGAPIRAPSVSERVAGGSFFMEFRGPKAHSNRPGHGNLEQAARNARLAFFHEHLALGRIDHAGRAGRVATGHTRSDQAETVLFRFLRGSGTAGLSGIRPVTGQGLVRPLIELERGEIEGFLRHRGIPWREDSSNATGEFARNRIRHHLLPQLAAEWNPAIVQTLAHTAEFAQEEEAFWEQEIARLAALHLTRDGDFVLVRAGVLATISPAAARRLVRCAVELAKGDLRGIDFRHIERIVELAAAAGGSGRMQIPGLEVRRSFDWLRLGIPVLRKPYTLRPEVPGITAVPGTGFAISLELIEISETSALPGNVYNTEMGCLDWKRLAGSLELRNWRFGDRFQPMGIPGTEKIKALFQLQRIPVWERAQWPVLTDGASIVWTRRFGPSAAFAAGPESTVVLKVGEVAIR